MTALSNGKGMKQPATWREAIDSTSRCPMCQSRYKKENAELCGTDARASKVHLTCSNCGSYALVMVLMLKQGVSSVGIATDLSFNDVARFEKLDAISLDEIIMGHVDLAAESLYRILTK